MSREDLRSPTHPDSSPGAPETEEEGVSDLLRSNLGPASTLHEYFLRSRSPSSASGGSQTRKSGRDRRTVSKNPQLNPRVELSRISSQMDGAATTTTEAAIQNLQQQISQILNIISPPQEAAPVPEITVQPPTEQGAPAQAAGLPAPIAPVQGTPVDYCLFNRGAMVENLKTFVDNPLAKKFNTGQKEELRHLFLLDTIFDTFPENIKAAHLKRLRLFYTVAHYGWPAALADREAQNRTTVGAIYPAEVNLQKRAGRSAYKKTYNKHKAGGARAPNRK